MTRRVHFAEGFVTAIHEYLPSPTVPTSPRSVGDRDEVLRCVHEFRQWVRAVKGK